MVKLLRISLRALAPEPVWNGRLPWQF
jgi:hypothetical protein